MGFRCDSCHEPQEKDAKGRNLKPHQIVTASRPVTYGDGTKGWEIVKEEKFCDVCFAQLPPQDPTPGGLTVAQTINKIADIAKAFPALFPKSPKPLAA